MRTNDTYPDCFQKYNASVLTKIVSLASSDVLSLLIPILDTTSQLSCRRLRSHVLCHAFCNNDQKVCVPSPISNDTIQCNESLQMSWWHQYIWSLLHSPLCLLTSRNKLLQLHNHNDCEHRHHFLLLKQVQLWEVKLYFLNCVCLCE